MLIDQNNTRRFQGPEGQVLAIYDQNRSFTLYAAVGVDQSNRLVFASTPRSYWSDEVEEIH
jgi:hypothetical protein